MPLNKYLMFIFIFYKVPMYIVSTNLINKKNFEYQNYKDITEFINGF